MRWPIIGALLALAFALGCQAGGPEQATPRQFISIATGGTGGTYYIVGAAMSKLLNKYIPGVIATSEATAAGVENAKLVGTKKVLLALIPPDTLYFGYRGEREFREKYDSLRAVLGGHVSVHHVVVRAESPIKSFADMKGKKIGIGAAGSAQEFFSYVILEANGLKKGDYKGEFLSYTEQVLAVKDGNLDVAILAGGIPQSSVVDITNSLPVRFMPFDEKALQRLIAEHPYFVATSVPPNTYKGQDKAVPAFGSGTVLTTHKDAPDDLVYNIAKIILEHADELIAIHPSGKEYTLENAVRAVQVPFHPGAEKYLKERGILK